MRDNKANLRTLYAAFTVALCALHLLVGEMAKKWVGGQDNSESRIGTDGDFFSLLFSLAVMAPLAFGFAYMGFEVMMDHQKKTATKSAMWLAGTATLIAAASTSVAVMNANASKLSGQEAADNARSNLFLGVTSSIGIFMLDGMAAVNEALKQNSGGCSMYGRGR